MRWLRASTLGVRGMLTGLRAIGLDTGDLCISAGIDQARLADPDGYVAILSVFRLWEDAVRRRGPDVGLRAAAAVPLGTFEVLDYVIATSATVGEALEQVCRYFRLGTNMARFEVNGDDGDERFVRFRHVIADALLPPVLRDYAVGNVATRLRAMSSGIRPRHAELTDSGRAGEIAYREVFGCAVRLRCRRNGLAISPRDWQHAMAKADPALGAVLRRHADEIVARQPRAGIDDAIRREVVAFLQNGEPTIDVVARRLAMSKRTLQRRLSEQRTDFSRLVDDARHELALGYLDNLALSVSEVALLLGFSEPSAFNRAFKRWTNTTPSSYRNRER